MSDNNKFKIGSIFESINSNDLNDLERTYRHTDDDETYGSYGASGHYLTQGDIDHLLNGGIIGIKDGEYEHYLRLKK